MAAEKNKLKDHQFDGIQEYDNPVPLWMSVIFAGTVLFSLFYVPYYHGLDAGELPTVAYEKEMAAAAALKAEQVAAQPALDVAALVADAAAVAAGKQVFTTTCAACHGQMGEGLVGPSFLDTAWRNGDGSLAAIIDIVGKGVLDKGMPSWTILGDAAVRNVAAYVYLLGQPQGAGGPAPVTLDAGPASTGAVP